MACYSPQHGFKSTSGGVVFKRGPSAYIDRPVTVPCGRCIGCRLEHSRQWGVRLTHEAKMHEENCFITLTYDEAHLPQNGSLNLTHWQQFAKRTRKRLGGFRYYHCGEYGTETGRPHYHAILFGIDFNQDRKAISRPGSSEPPNRWTSKTLDELWGHGNTLIGVCNFQTSQYVAKYILKRITGPNAEDHYEHFDQVTGETTQRKPEYATMSRRPGIGSAWIKKYKSDVYPADHLVINGVETRPPRYYDSRLPEPELNALKKQRKAKATTEAMRKHSTPERLASRERVTIKNMALLSKRGDPGS